MKDPFKLLSGTKQKTVERLEERVIDKGWGIDEITEGAREYFKKCGK